MHPSIHTFIIPSHYRKCKTPKVIQFGQYKTRRHSYIHSSYKHIHSTIASSVAIDRQNKNKIQSYYHDFCYSFIVSIPPLGR